VDAELIERRSPRLSLGIVTRAACIVEVQPSCVRREAWMGGVRAEGSRSERTLHAHPRSLIVRIAALEANAPDMLGLFYEKTDRWDWPDFWDENRFFLVTAMRMMKPK
jgi:hypothetical protein